MDAMIERPDAGDPGTLHAETPDLFFKEMVDRVLEDCRLEPSEDSAAYLVHMLARFVRPGGLLNDVGARPEHPLGRMLLHGVDTVGPERFVLLRCTGDLALFLSGFFVDCLERRRVSEEYYRSIGSMAYGHAAGCCRPRASASLFEELADRFGELTVVLHHVSERCGTTSNASLRGQIVASGHLH
ncbi:MAG: hypothetical protein AAGE94_04045 [Acidobacteriota bacterium]